MQARASVLESFKSPLALRDLLGGNFDFYLGIDWDSQPTMMQVVGGMEGGDEPPRQCRRRVEIVAGDAHLLRARHADPTREPHRDAATRLHADARRVREPYLNHLLRVAIRIIRYYGITDVDVLTAALLHDAVEDQPEDLAPSG